MKAFIPNLLTLLNLLSGCIGVVFAISGELTTAAAFVFAGIFFDFFDGFIARKLKVESALGLQLDSMADLVTSGLVPGLVLFELFQHSMQGPRLLTFIIPYMGFIVTLASAYRLARFNISTNQKDYFIGLPTPANALMILSLPLVVFYDHNPFYNAIIGDTWFLLGFTLLSSFLLNAPFKLMALKFKNWNLYPNKEKFILLFLSLVFLIIFKYAGILYSILIYVLFSLIKPPKDV